jgi:hypothetical protein
MREYLRKADQLTGASRSLARLSHVLGADAPSSNPSPSVTREFLREIGASRPRDVEDGFGTAAGAVVGGYLGATKFKSKDHPVMSTLGGAIGGASLARNVPALFDPSLRKPAARNLLMTGAGLGASYYARDQKWYVQVLAFIGGEVAGSLAGSAIGLFDE